MSKEKDLVQAAWKGDITQVTKLLDKGVNVDTVWCLKGPDKLIKANEECSQYSDNTPLTAASYKGHLQIVLLLLNRGAKVNISPSYKGEAIHYAVRGGNIAIVSLLLDRGASVNARASYGDTPLSDAVAPSTNQGVLSLPIVSLLLECGADVNTYKNNGWTILHGAAFESNLLILSLLLKNKPNINARDRNGQTPLYAAVVKGNASIVSFLIDSGADINAKDENDNTILHHAINQKKASVVSLLIDRGAEINIKNKEGKTPRDCATDKAILTVFDQHHQVVQVNSLIISFQKALEQPSLIDINYLSIMFKQVYDLYTFRFPYTLTSIYRKMNPHEQQKVDDLIIINLKLQAEKVTISSEYVAIYKLILRSAFNKGIIDRKLKYELDNIAESAKIFSDKRFVELFNKVEQLQKRVDIVERNVQIIATSINNLKAAMRRKAKRDMLFGIAKIALAFIGSQAVDFIAGITDFSDMAEMSVEIFGHSISEIGQAILENKRIILSVATEQVLKRAGLDPADYLKTWYEMSLMLQAVPSETPELSSFSPQNTQQFFIAKPIAKTVPKTITGSVSQILPKVDHPASSLSPITALPKAPQTATIIASPSSSSATIESSPFVNWLHEVQSYGQFKISINEKVLAIQFINVQKNDEEIENILFTLNGYLKDLPDLKRIDIEERDVDNNSLLLTTKTKLDAKQLNSILEKYYKLTTTFLKVDTINSVASVSSLRP